jgi:hypothetical protein
MPTRPDAAAGRAEPERLKEGQMNGKQVIGGGALLALALAAAAAQAQWSSGGWGVGHGTGSGLGRFVQPITVDLWPIDNGTSISVTVSGCGGARDYRSFGTDIVGGEGEADDAAAALTRLLGEARRVCAFEPRLGARVEEGFRPAFDAWLEELAAMGDMNMSDMNMEFEVTSDTNAQIAADMALDSMDMNMATECTSGEC